MKWVLALLLAMSVWSYARAEDDGDPWKIQMKQPFTIDQYCLTTRESVTYKVILDPESSIFKVLNAYVLDFHHKTTVLHREMIPWIYLIFTLILLFGMFGFMKALVHQSERIIKGVLRMREKSLELKQPKILERREGRREERKDE